MLRCEIQVTIVIRSVLSTLSFHLLDSINDRMSVRQSFKLTQMYVYSLVKVIYKIGCHWHVSDDLCYSS